MNILLSFKSCPGHSPNMDPIEHLSFDLEIVIQDAALSHLIVRDLKGQLKEPLVPDSYTDYQ